MTGAAEVGLHQRRRLFPVGDGVGEAPLAEIHAAGALVRLVGLGVETQGDLGFRRRLVVAILVRR